MRSSITGSYVSLMLVGLDYDHLPAQLRTTTYCPEIIQSLPCLRERHINALRVREVADIVQ